MVEVVEQLSLDYALIKLYVANKPQIGDKITGWLLNMYRLKDEDCRKGSGYGCGGHVSYKINDGVVYGI